MTKSAAESLSDEALAAEVARRAQVRWEETIAPQKAALQPFVDLGFGEDRIVDLVDGIGNALPGLTDDQALYQVFANVRLALDGAQQAIAARLRSLTMPPPVF